MKPAPAGRGGRHPCGPARSRAPSRPRRHSDVTPLLILDQFEEHFLYRPVGGAEFDDALARLYQRDAVLTAHVLISIREDAYRCSATGSRHASRTSTATSCTSTSSTWGGAPSGRLGRLRRIELALSGRRGARTRPSPLSSPRWSNRSGADRSTIGDVGPPDVSCDGPRVEPAYLQLVMHRLWDEEASVGSRRLRLRRWSGWGAPADRSSAPGRGHGALPSDQRDDAAAAFRFLVTASGRKIALSTDDLVGFTDTAAQSLEPALAQLETQRILRAVPSPEPSGAPSPDLPRRVGSGDRRLEAAPRRGAAARRQRTPAGRGPRSRAPARGAQSPSRRGGRRPRGHRRRACALPVGARASTTAGATDG